MANVPRRRWLVALLRLGALLSLVACGQADPSGSSPADTTGFGGGVFFGGDAVARSLGDVGAGAVDAGVAALDAAVGDVSQAADALDLDSGDGADADTAGGVIGWDATAPFDAAGAPDALCACDDGDSCTQDDCKNGVCSHVITVDCSPLNGPCTAGVCQQGSCVAAAKSDGGPCDDGDACSVQDACLGGQCFGKIKDCSGSAGPCQTATCSGGVCGAVVKPTGSACSDNDPCTTGDGCYGGVCSAKPMDCSDKAGPCTLAACKNGACATSFAAVGSLCQDGDACTTGDACTSKGACVGKALNCSAKNGVCKVGTCLGGTCIAKASPDGSTCSDGEACTLSDACKSGVCVGKAAQDPYEPNASPPGKNLGAKSDCDAASTFTASISPKSDVDWYSFKVTDKSFCTLQPEVKISGMTADLQMCIYMTCDSGWVGSNTVTCAAGSLDDGGPGGAFGCCSHVAGTLTEFAKIKPKCSTLSAGSESGTVFVSVRSNGAFACSGYTMTWGAAK